VVVEIAERLAKRGYVVAVADYRLGWNPGASTQDERTLTLINAAYRGVQDARTCIRYFKKDVVEGTNQFGVDTSRITLWGQGTGGYISLATATLDDYAEVVLPKFSIDFMGVPVPMVIQDVNGDIFGTSVGIVTPPFDIPPFTAGDTLCYPNHVGYDSDFQLCVNMGGALGDTSWLDPGDPPMISFQVPGDPNAPYVEDILVVPTTGDLVVEVQGSYLVQQRANGFGNNDVFNDYTWIDPYSQRADAINDGYGGLFPLEYPKFEDPMNPGDSASISAPWEWWDQAEWENVFCDLQPGIPLNLIGLAGNPLMSEAQGMAYVDTIMGYFLPRACLALDLGCDLDAFTSTQEVLTADVVNLTLAPNPANQEVLLQSDADAPMLDVMLFDMSGRLLQSHMNVHTDYFLLQRDNIPTGMYLLRVRFEEGMVTQKLIYR
jgi:hypothetical protein